MAEPIEFAEQNTVWRGPGDVDDLPAFFDADTGQTISCWRLNEKELVEVQAKGVVWLYVWGNHPPVSIAGLDPFEDRDTGLHDNAINEWFEDLQGGGTD